MTAEEWGARARAIETKANEELERARCSVWLAAPSRRSARYSSGMADAIREMAIAGQREAIEARMQAEMEALDAEFYGISEQELTHGDEAADSGCS